MTTLFERMACREYGVYERHRANSCRAPVRRRPPAPPRAGEHGLDEVAQVLVLLEAHAWPQEQRSRRGSPRSSSIDSASALRSSSFTYLHEQRVRLERPADHPRSSWMSRPRRRRPDPRRRASGRPGASRGAASRGDGPPAVGGALSPPPEGPRSPSRSRSGGSVLRHHGREVGAAAEPWGRFWQGRAEGVRRGPRLRGRELWSAGGGGAPLLLGSRRQGFARFCRFFLAAALLPPATTGVVVPPSGGKFGWPSWGRGIRIT